VFWRLRKRFRRLPITIECLSAAVTGRIFDDRLPLQEHLFARSREDAEMNSRCTSLSAFAALREK